MLKKRHHEEGSLGSEERKLAALLGLAPPPAPKRQKVVVATTTMIPFLAEEKKLADFLPGAATKIDPDETETESEPEQEEYLAIATPAPALARASVTAPPDAYEVHYDAFMNAIEELPFIGDELEEGGVYTPGMLTEDMANILEDIFRQTGYRLAMGNEDLLIIGLNKFDLEDTQQNRKKLMAWLSQAVDHLNRRGLRLREQELGNILEGLEERFKQQDISAL